MVLPTGTGRAPSPAASINLARLLWVGPLTVVASTAAVLVVRFLAVALLLPPPDFTPLGLDSVAVLTAMLITCAVLVFLLVSLFASTPTRVFHTIAMGALLLSFVPDLTVPSSHTPLTLLLAAVGLYSVAAHSVSVRTREIGIRMSLGARGTDVFRMVMGESLSLSFIGIVVGLGLGAAASRVVTSFLFGLSGVKPATFALGVAVLGVVAMVASYLPARWAARVDPLIALRHD